MVRPNFGGGGGSHRKDEVPYYFCLHLYPPEFQRRSVNSLRAVPTVRPDSISSSRDRLHPGEERFPKTFSGIRKKDPDRD